MSDEAELSEGEFKAEYVSGDELAVLKQRARLMGIVFSNNIGVASLRQKIAAKQNEEEGVEAEGENPLAVTNAANPLAGEKPEVIASKPRTLRQALIEDELKLVRLRITNMDPKKKDLPGEIFTLANEYLGTVCKYIPFGSVTDDGYHVPYCLYTMMKNRKFLNIRTIKGANGQTRVEHGWAHEFALEVLPTLTKNDLAKLANAQAAAGIIENASETL